ncbi:MAG: recombinase family protein [Deltaproteobacteria bacterium]|nr:recombinase family protein [Deltaproteobacteria bacterium]
MKKAYLYSRMSTLTQLRGDSKRRQEERARQYVEEKGYEFIEYFDDFGVSAFHGKNIKEGELGKFRLALEEGVIDPQNTVLVVESLDRLSRENVLDAFEELNKFLKTGVTIVTLIDKQEYTRESLGGNIGILFTAIGVMLRANDESAHKSDRLKEAWQQKRKDIRTKPLTSICPAWLIYNKSSNKYNVIDERGKIVKKIYEMSLGGQGNFIITRWLNESMIPTWGRSKGWHKSYVQKILKNRAVLGEFQPHKMINGKREECGETITGYFPEVIDRQTFYEVQDLRESRYVGGGRKGRRMSNLFMHMAKCGICQSSMSYINKGPKPKGGQYLVCSKAWRGMGCLKLLWPYSDFQTTILACIEKVDFSTFFNNEEVTARISKLRTDLGDENVKLKECESRLNRLLNLVEEGAVIPEIRERIEYLNDERNISNELIKSISSKLTKESRKVENLGDKVHELEEIIGVGREVSSSTGEALALRYKLHQLLRSAINRIDVYPGGYLHLKPKKEQRCLAIYYASGERAIVEPSFIEPSKIVAMKMADGTAYLDSEASDRQEEWRKKHGITAERQVGKPSYLA